MSGRLLGPANSNSNSESVTVGICWGAGQAPPLRVPAKGLAAPAAASFAPLGGKAGVRSRPFQPKSLWHVLAVGARRRNSRDRWSLCGPLRLLSHACLESCFGLAPPELPSGGNSKPALGLGPLRMEQSYCRDVAGEKGESGRRTAQAECPG